MPLTARHQEDPGALTSFFVSLKAAIAGDGLSKSDGEEGF